MVIVAEPHKRYDAERERREVHYHLVVKFRQPFAHFRVNQDMAALGAHGKWTFNLCGFAAYLHYVLKEGPNKIATNLDKEPCFWPGSFTAVHAQQIMEEVSNSQIQRQGNADVKDQMEACAVRRPCKRRKTLTMSEFTDLIVEHHVETEQQLYALAKRPKMEGETLLWDFVLSAKEPEKLLAKVLRAWNSERMAPTVLHQKSKWAVSDFHLPPLVKQWHDEHRLTHTLVLSGPGGCGKTALCAALLSAHGSFYFLDKLEAIKLCSFHSTTSLLVDDVCLRANNVDDCKSWLDVTACRFAACRHQDGLLPPGLRIFTTNWDKRGFLPEEARHEEHVAAIDRRMWWVEVQNDLRKTSSCAPPEQTQSLEARLWLQRLAASS